MNNKIFICSICILLIACICTATFDFSKTPNVVTSVPPNCNCTVIIDAGHGGFDGGCLGNDGTLEKDINLEISIKLNVLLKSLGFNTVMIRETDTAVNTKDGTIREKKVSDIKYRHSVMERYPNSIYLCIHQNQYPSSSISGAQVFYSPNDEESKFLAENIQKSIADKIQKNNKRKVKKCTKDVYLIHNATTSAVLIECGFLSNQNELSKLKTYEYQQQICFSIAIGLFTFINES